MADKDVTIAFKTESDLAAAQQTESAIKDVGDRASTASEQSAEAGQAGATAMEGISREAQAATAAMREAEEAAKDLARASGGGEVVGFGDNGRSVSIRQAAAAEAQRQAEAATRAKENEARATRQLTEAEKDLTAAQEERGEQARQDVEDAEARQAERRAQEADLAESEANVLRRGAGYAAALFASFKAADAVTQSFLASLQAANIDLEKLRETNPGDFLWVDMLQNVSSPLQAIKDFVASGFANMAGLDDLQRGAEQSERMAQSLQKAKEQMKLWAAVDNNIRLANLDAELRAVKGITAELERQITLQRSARELEETKAQIADNQAIRDGADPNVVAAQAAARQGQASIAALNEDLLKSQRGVDEAQALVAQANEKLLDAMKAGASNLDVSQAQDAFIKAQESLDQITANAQVFEQTTANSKAQILARVEDAFKVAGIDIEKGMAEEGRALVAKVTGAGSELTALQKDAKARLDNILADGKVAASESVAFQQAFQQMISGMRTDTATYLQLANESNSLISGMTGALDHIKQEQARLRAQVNQLSSR